MWAAIPIVAYRPQRKETETPLLRMDFDFPYF